MEIFLNTQNKLHEVLNQNKDKLSWNPKVENVLQEWDTLKLSKSMLDLQGCLLSNEIHVKSAPNATHFIVRESQHASDNISLLFSIKDNSTIYY